MCLFEGARTPSVLLMPQGIVQKRLCFSIGRMVAGGMIGGFFATNIGSMQPFGIEGWRFAFHLMAAVSLITSALVYYLATEPRPTAKVGLPVCTLVYCLATEPRPTTKVGLSVCLLVCCLATEPRPTAKVGLSVCLLVCYLATEPRPTAKVRLLKCFRQCCAAV